MTRRICTQMIAMAVASLAAASAYATPTITLTDQNAVATIDPYSDAGMNSWFVQGQTQLVQQWFWYRIGDTGPEAPINAISAPVYSQTASTANITYADNTIRVNVKYSLTGSPIAGLGDTVPSDVAETISIENLSGRPLNLHFYQYSNFNLDGLSNDTVQLLKIGVPLKYVEADQWSGDGSSTMTETVFTPKANHGEVGFAGTTLAKLNDMYPTTLADSTAPFGPGNVTWAFQWDTSMVGGSTMLISKDKRLDVVITPEPASLAMLSIGVLALVARRRRV